MKFTLVYNERGFDDLETKASPSDISMLYLIHDQGENRLG